MAGHVQAGQTALGGMDGRLLHAGTGEDGMRARSVVDGRTQGLMAARTAGAQWQQALLKVQQGSKVGAVWQTELT